MGTRYSRRCADGITEHYESWEALRDVENHQARTAIAIWFGLAGLLIGGTLTYVGLHLIDGAELPKLLRFAAVILGASLGAYILSRLANVIIILAAISVFVSIVIGIGLTLWHIV